MTSSKIEPATNNPDITFLISYTLSKETFYPFFFFVIPRVILSLASYLFLFVSLPIIHSLLLLCFSSIIFLPDCLNFFFVAAICIFRICVRVTGWQDQTFPPSPPPSHCTEEISFSDWWILNYGTLVTGLANVIMVLSLPSTAGRQTTNTSAITFTLSLINSQYHGFSVLRYG
jgi:hypothetical protein